MYYSSGAASERRCSIWPTDSTTACVSYSFVTACALATCHCECSSLSSNRRLTDRSATARLADEWFSTDQLSVRVVFTVTVQYSWFLCAYLMTLAEPQAPNGRRKAWNIVIVDIVCVPNVCACVVVVAVIVVVVVVVVILFWRKASRD